LIELLLRLFSVVLGCSVVVVVAIAVDDGEKKCEMQGGLYTFP
jgi:hypothetical protein